MGLHRVGGWGQAVFRFTADSGPPRLALAASSIVRRWRVMMRKRLRRGGGFVLRGEGWGDWPRSDQKPSRGFVVFQLRRSGAGAPGRNAFFPNITVSISVSTSARISSDWTFAYTFRCAN